MRWSYITGSRHEQEYTGHRTSRYIVIKNLRIQSSGKRSLEESEFGQDIVHHPLNLIRPSRLPSYHHPLGWRLICHRNHHHLYLQR